MSLDGLVPIDVTFVEVILGNALVATLLAFAVWVFVRFFRRPAIAHALWLLVLVKLCVPAPIRIPLSLIQTSETEVDAIGVTDRASLSGEQSRSLSHPMALLIGEESSHAVIPPRVDPRPGSESSDTRPPLGIRDRAGAGVVREPNPPNGVAVTPAAEKLLPEKLVPEKLLPDKRVEERSETTGSFTVGLWTWIREHLGWLLGLWVVGSAFWLARFIVGSHRVTRLVGASSVASEEVRDEVGRLSPRVGLRQPPRVRVLGLRLPPMLAGIPGRATLLLPSGLMEAISPAGRATLLTHELAHLRRRDHWVRWLEALCVIGFWWLPTTWWAIRELRRFEEECCDAWVVATHADGARSYAKALLAAVDFLSVEPMAIPRSATALGDSASLRRRVEMILGKNCSPRMSLPARGLVTCLGICVLPALPVVAGVGSVDDPVVGNVLKVKPAKGVLKADPRIGNPFGQAARKLDPAGMAPRSQATRNLDPFAGSRPAGSPFAGSPFAGGPFAGNPFGQAGSESDPVIGNPFGQAARKLDPAGVAPFAQTTRSVDPAVGNPFGQAARNVDPASGNLFGQAARKLDLAGMAPFGQAARDFDPAGTTPFAQAARNVDPTTANPFRAAAIAESGIGDPVASDPRRVGFDPTARNPGETSAEDPIVQGPIVQGPIVQGPIVQDPIVQDPRNPGELPPQPDYGSPIRLEWMVGEESAADVAKRLTETTGILWIKMAQKEDRVSLVGLPTDVDASSIILGPGDRLVIRCQDEAALNGRYVVHPDGYLNLPWVGAVRFIGLSSSHASEVLDVIYAPFLMDPRFEARVESGEDPFSDMILERYALHYTDADEIEVVASELVAGKDGSIHADSRTNSILVAGSPTFVGQVRNVLVELDQPSDVEVRRRVGELEQAAADLSTQLKIVQDELRKLKGGSGGVK